MTTIATIFGIWVLLDAVIVWLLVRCKRLPARGRAPCDKPTVYDEHGPAAP